MYILLVPLFFLPEKVKKKKKGLPASVNGLEKFCTYLQSLCSWFIPWESSNTSPGKTFPSLAHGQSGLVFIKSRVWGHGFMWCQLVYQETCWPFKTILPFSMASVPSLANMPHRYKIQFSRDFPGCLVAKTPSSWFGGLGSIPGQGTSSHISQLKILHAATKTHHSQIYITYIYNFSFPFFLNS